MTDSTKPDHFNINAKICRLVEQYPCMYDRSHAHYLKKDVVDQAWDKISKEMKDSVSSCKERWRNIRTSYARSINVNKVPASANRTKPYYLHEELQFLALHITPGIPVSRRSASNSLNGSNSYYNSPRNDKGDITKTSLCDESADSYAAVMHEEPYYKSQYNQEERSSSVTSDTTFKNIQEIERDTQQNEAAQQLPQLQQQSPINLAPLENTTENEHFPPIVHIDDDNPEIPNKRTNSINYACAPPKKRLRVKDNCYASDNFTDIKPVDLLPQHDYDEIFLQGLLPEMKAMDFLQKIIFKRRIYEVLGEIFDNSTQASSTTNNQLPQGNHASSSSTTSSLLTVNSSDLFVLRKINNILQELFTSANNTSAHSASISSTVLSAPAAPSPDVLPSGKIGATTRASAHMIRGRLGNVNTIVPSQNIKAEPESN